MSILIETMTHDQNWEILDLPALAQRAADALAQHLNIPASHAALLACGDGRIADLNNTFRGKPTATNILSWPGTDRAPHAPGGTPLPVHPDIMGDIHLGDMAIAYGVCAHEAAAQGKTLSAHVTHLIIHGLLHLLGYDHETDPDAARMENLEREILGKLGLPDPY